MKTILILLFLTLTLKAEVPPFQTVNLAFDYPNAGNVTFYLRATNGPLVTVIGVTTNVAFTWENVTPLSWKLGVTASNIWGESNPSIPLILPAPPSIPTNLRPLTTTFKVLSPVSFERSSDLSNWDERFRLFRPDSNGVQIVMQTITPRDPFMFYRVRPNPVIGQPPYPANKQP